MARRPKTIFKRPARLMNVQMPNLSCSFCMEVRFGAVLVMAVPLLIAFESFSGSEIRGALRDYLEHP